MIRQRPTLCKSRALYFRGCLTALVRQPLSWESLFPAALAVGALIDCGIGLVGTDQNTVQRAVVFGLAVVGALMNGALHALVRMTVHMRSSLILYRRKTDRFFRRTEKRPALSKLVWHVFSG